MLMLVLLLRSWCSNEIEIDGWRNPISRATRNHFHISAKHNRFDSDRRYECNWKSSILLSFLRLRQVSASIMHDSAECSIDLSFNLEIETIISFVHSFLRTSRTFPSFGHIMHSMLLLSNPRECVENNVRLFLTLDLIALTLRDNFVTRFAPKCTLASHRSFNQ